MNLPVSSPDFERVRHCRTCGGPLVPVLSLGTTPLATALALAGDDQQPPIRYPRDLVRCPSCSLVQLAQLVPPTTLFADYVYFSSYSTTMLEHAECFASELVRREGLGPESR